MEKPFRVLVFGKSACDKCRTLQRRLEELLGREEWSDFEIRSCDVETVEGMVSFCRAECINPQRIPAFLVLRRGESGDYLPLSRPVPGEADPACGASALYSLIGLQTDYSPAGRGVLSPRMILAALTEAREAAPPLRRAPGPSPAHA